MLYIFNADHAALCLITWLCVNLIPNLLKFFYLEVIFTFSNRKFSSETTLLCLLLTLCVFFFFFLKDKWDIQWPDSHVKSVQQYSKICWSGRKQGMCFNTCSIIWWMHVSGNILVNREEKKCVQISQFGGVFWSLHRIPSTLVFPSITRLVEPGGTDTLPKLSEIAVGVHCSRPRPCSSSERCP